MLKKCTVFLEGVEYSIDPRLVDFLNLLEYFGFFIRRGVENQWFLSKNLHSCVIAQKNHVGDTPPKSKTVLPPRPPHSGHLSYSHTYFLIALRNVVEASICKPDSSRDLSEIFFLCDVLGSIVSVLCVSDETANAFCAAMEATEGSDGNEIATNDLPVVGGCVKDKMKSPVKSKKEKITVSETVQKISSEWLQSAIKKMPHLKQRFTQEKFELAVNKIKTYTKANDEQIYEIWEFIKNDQFWSDQAISPLGLMQISKNGNYKLDNVLIQMRSKLIRENPFLENDDDWKNPFV